MKNFHDAFLGKSVLVTGHTGFKGSWLSLWLNELGAQVTGYALDPISEPNHFDVANVGEVLKNDFRLDIRDGTQLLKVIASTKPDYIFHLAAQPIVSDGYKRPYETFEVNVLGTANLLDAVRESGNSAAVIVVTSDKCYLNDGSGHVFVETDPLGGHDPYSASKAATEILVESYRSSFFPKESIGSHGVFLATARAGNVIGGGDWCNDRIVPDAMRAFSQGDPVKLRSPGSTRPWQHVLEPLSGYLLLASKIRNHDVDYCGAWNFGPNGSNEKSVEDLTSSLSINWPGSSWSPVENVQTNNEPVSLAISSAKASSQLGWHATWSFNETVSETVSWYRKYYEDSEASMRDYTLATINRYTDG